MNRTATRPQRTGHAAVRSLPTTSVRRRSLTHMLYPFTMQLARPLLFSACLLPCAHARANNIQVSNVSLTGNTGTTVQIQFDLSWENSWRGGGVNNWDAAWVFIKYNNGLGGPWGHLNLHNTGHVAPAGSQIDLGLQTPGSAYNATTNPCLGVFIYRNAPGAGDLTLTTVQLRCNYAAAGLTYGDLTLLKVFAVEMVYVPQGAFAAGSGGSETDAFTLTTINTASATTYPGGVGSLGGEAGGFPTWQPPPTNASWPNGFGAFYCMKYEVSQQGYVDFLNTLTYTQQVTRTELAPNSPAGTGALEEFNTEHNGVDIQTPGVVSTTPAVYACNLTSNTVFGEAVDGKDIACNYLSWGDLTAYLDWSGLRPMTELEYEKACRGTIAPVPNEYPWGTTGIASSVYTIANARATNEGIATNYSTTLGNASYSATDGSIDGPLRVGIFAANPVNSGRVTAGASYYGIMELGGNLAERSVSMANALGLAYTGTHGNGALAVSGQPDDAAWPAGPGCIERGGTWFFDAAAVCVSNRFFSTFDFSYRRSGGGGRGVRSVP